MHSIHSNNKGRNLKSCPCWFEISCSQKLLLKDVEPEPCEIGCVFVLAKFHIKVINREKLNLLFSRSWLHNIKKIIRVEITFYVQWNLTL